MAKWITVAEQTEFLPGTCRAVDVEGTPVAVFNIDGNYYAIADVCTHEAETLSDGETDGLEIICPRHGARFSLVSGAALAPPAYEPVATFPVRIEMGLVQVSDESC